NKAAETVTDLEHAITVSSPVVGEQVSLDRIEDATFSKEILGATAAIQSADGRIYAPMAATVKAVFPTKHAIGLALENGVELLIHIGLDTVSMNGEGFELNVQQGDLVQKGDVLLTFDQDLIKSKQLNDVIIVVITNTETFGAVRKNENVSKIDLNQNLFDITK
ncbi:MAG: PTS glucose transporter subunit IIA, partial [Enterococcus hulanensis]